MNQSGSTAKEKNCPVCGKEGQAITCTSGNISENIFYHSIKRHRTICHIACNSNVENRVEGNKTETT